MTTLHNDIFKWFNIWL